MRECLKCKKSIEGKHESAKFCSTSCRVMYHRKFGNTKAVNPVQVQVLYNAMLDMVEKVGGKSVLEPTHLFVPKNEHITITYQAPKTAAKYLELKRECETADQWQTLWEEINGSNLSYKEKQILKAAT